MGTRPINPLEPYLTLSNLTHRLAGSTIDLATSLEQGDDGRVIWVIKALDPWDGEVGPRTAFKMVLNEDNDTTPVNTEVIQSNVGWLTEIWERGKVFLDYNMDEGQFRLLFGLNSDDEYVVREAEEVGKGGVSIVKEVGVREDGGVSDEIKVEPQWKKRGDGQDHQGEAKHDYDDGLVVGPENQSGKHGETYAGPSGDSPLLLLTADEVIQPRRERDMMQTPSDKIQNKACTSGKRRQDMELAIEVIEVSVASSP
ncbi:hypothetical protein IAR55_005785 [Kwoniella newhampshirensis]|uniref:Uncharacterized protein n=1 Tax=Kwoniella newhampshirensis TaxID=1651941 RepID=A0AAW0YVG4_9TREE